MFDYCTLCHQEVLVLIHDTLLSRRFDRILAPKLFVFFRNHWAVAAVRACKKSFRHYSDILPLSLPFPTNFENTDFASFYQVILQCRLLDFGYRY